MKKIIKHIILSVLLIFSATIFKAQNTEPYKFQDTIPVYRRYLDSAYLYQHEGKYREATSYYAGGFQAYKEYYRNRLDAVNRQLAQEYETDKKQDEYNRLNETLKLKKTQLYLFYVLITVLVIALVLLWFIQKYRLRVVKQLRRQKANETFYLKLEKEKQELEAQLNTLQAGKYQKELLAGTVLVESKDKALDELRRFFEQHPRLHKYRTELEKTLANETLPEHRAGKSDTGLQQIHPSFYARLQKQAGNKLTPLDLKYCRMIFLRMSSKEMADTLGVDPKTIRVTKYRLKKKLRLEKEDGLSGFIEKIVGQS